MSDQTTPGQPPPPLTEIAESQIRETAKWLCVVMAGIAGVLIAGSQLSDLGSLPGKSPRLWLAVFGVLLAGGGTIAILHCTTRVLARPLLSLTELVTNPPPSTEDATSDPLLLAGFPNVEAMNASLRECLTARRAAWEAHLADPSNPTTQSAYKVAVARTSDIQAAVQPMLRMASYGAVQGRWDQARRSIVIAGAIAGIGVCIFAWAAHPPEDPQSAARVQQVHMHG